MRRLLFVRRSRGARRAPSYLAFVVLAALGLAGLGVTSAPQEPAPPKAVEPERPAGKANDGGQQVPLPIRTPERRSNWM